MESLVARIRAGDAAALDAVFRRHFVELCAVSYRYLRSRAAAEDVVHDVFASLWAERATLVVRTTLAAYLHGAVRNRAVSAVRREIVERRWRAEVEVTQTLAPGHVVNTAEHHLAAADATRMVNEVLAGLSGRCREAAILRWQRQMSLAEIGRAMGISLKTVEVHLTRAYGALRSRWSAEARAPLGGQTRD